MTLLLYEYKSMSVLCSDKVVAISRCNVYSWSWQNAFSTTVDTFYSDAIQTAEKGLRVSGVRLYIQPFPFQLEYKNNNGDN